MLPESSQLFIFFFSLNPFTQTTEFIIAFVFVKPALGVCICVVWTLFHLHVARVRVYATCIQTALWLLILGLNSLSVKMMRSSTILLLDKTFIQHFGKFLSSFLKKNPAYLSSSSVRSPSQAMQMKVSSFLPIIERHVKSQTRNQVSLFSAVGSRKDVIWFLFVRILIQIPCCWVLKDSETRNAIFDIRILSSYFYLAGFAC